MSLSFLFISHIARYAPSSQKRNQLKIQLKPSQLIIIPLLKSESRTYVETYLLLLYTELIPKNIIE